jgi:antitoxin component YwqK of YwqJK toxin-antitoxin module
VSNFKFILFVFGFLEGFTHCLYSQNVIKPKELYKPTQEEVVDPEYGIIIYNKLVPCLGGDSIRYNKAGYNAQSWQEDYYASGKLLHRGFYIDGQIKVFKNYWENGNLERELIAIDNLRCKMITYYPSGQMRSEVTYYEGSEIKEKDYFENGSIELEEEIDKKDGHIIKRIINYPDSKPKVIMELTDKKLKVYSYKEFYENGNIKEEGALNFRKDMNDYVKNGDWKFYDESGKLVKTANFVNNEEQKN